MTANLNETIFSLFRERHFPNSFFNKAARNLAKMVPPSGTCHREEIYVFFTSKSCREEEEGQGGSSLALESLGQLIRDLDNHYPIRVWLENDKKPQPATGTRVLHEVATYFAKDGPHSSDEIIRAALCLPGELIPERRWKYSYFSAASQAQRSGNLNPLAAICRESSKDSYKHKLSRLLSVAQKNQKLLFELEQVPWECWAKMYLSELAKELSLHYQFIEPNPAKSLLNLWNSYASRFAANYLRDLSLLSEVLLARVSRPMYRELLLIDSSRYSSLAQVLEQTGSRAKGVRKIPASDIAALYENISLEEVSCSYPSSQALDFVKRLELIKRANVPPGLAADHYDKASILGTDYLDEWWQLIFMKHQDETQLVRTTKKWLQSL